MLSALRTAAGTWVAKLLLLLLVGSFAIWGISGKMMDNFHTGSTVVSAGGTSVSVIEYRLAYDRQLNLLSQQFGQRLSREQANAMGADQQVLSQLVAGVVLDEQARELGLGLSKDRLATLTTEDPAFRGPTGQFDRQQFEYILRQIGMRPEDYFRSRSQEAVRRQIIEAVSDGLQAPDTFLKAVALYRGEDRTVDYLVLPSSLVEPIDKPSDDVLAKWFEENKKTYAAPEYRKLTYVKLEPEDIADETSITDDQVNAEYQKNKARFTTPETRTIEQLVFKTPEAAKSAADSLKGGATFEQIVAGEKKTQGDVLLGTLAKDKIADKAVAEAAFALSANQVSDVVQGAFGPVLLRVTEIKPEIVKPLAEVTPEIRKDLALAEANRILLDVHDSYEDARAAGETLREAAAKLKLKVVTVDAIDQTALRPDGATVEDLPSSPELLRAAFATEASIENEPVNIGSTGFVFFEVEGITPARDRTLDEVHDKALADWTHQETVSRLAAKSADFAKRLKDGTTLDELAAELKLEKQTKRGLKREADDGDFGKAGVSAVFGVADAGSGLVQSPTGDEQILFKVTEVFEPAGVGPESVPEDAKKTFSSGVANDLLDQLVARLQTEYPVTIDQAAMARAMTF